MKASRKEVIYNRLLESLIQFNISSDLALTIVNPTAKYKKPVLIVILTIFLIAYFF